MPKLARDADVIPSIQELLATPEIRSAFAYLDQNNGFSDHELITICEIAAPPFKEELRGRFVEERLRELDLGDVVTDSAGNVLASRAGSTGDPVVLISAHLDTVFPEETDVLVRRDGNRLYAPGISDNACGVASLLGLARAMAAAGMVLSHPTMQTIASNK